MKQIQIEKNKQLDSGFAWDLKVTRIYLRYPISVSFKYQGKEAVLYVDNESNANSLVQHMKSMR